MYAEDNKDPYLFFHYSKTHQKLLQETYTIWKLLQWSNCSFSFFYACSNWFHSTIIKWSMFVKVSYFRYSGLPVKGSEEENTVAKITCFLVWSSTIPLNLLSSRKLLQSNVLFRRISAVICPFSLLGKAVKYAYLSCPTVAEPASEESAGSTTKEPAHSSGSLVIGLDEFEEFGRSQFAKVERIQWER